MPGSIKMAGALDHIPWRHLEALPYTLNGSYRFKMKKTITESNPLWNRMIWAMKHMGTRAREYGHSSTHRCLGLIECTSCPWTKRAPTKVNLTTTFRPNDCLKCGQATRHVPCDVFYSTKIPSAGPDIEVEVYEIHKHREPPNGLVNNEQQDESNEIHRISPNATPMPLKTCARRTDEGQIRTALDINKSLVDSWKLKYNLTKASRVKRYQVLELQRHLKPQTYPGPRKQLHR